MGIDKILIPSPQHICAYCVCSFLRTHRKETETLEYTSTKYGFVYFIEYYLFFRQQRNRFALLRWSTIRMTQILKIKWNKYVSYGTRFFCPTLKCSRAGLHFGARVSFSGLDETFFGRTQVLTRKKCSYCAVKSV